MDTDCGPRSKQLNLHYRHPHHASINAQRSQISRNPHNPQPTLRHHQQASRRQLLRAAPDEDRAAQETSDGGASRLTRAVKTPAPSAGLPTQADLWPASRQLPVSASINSQHQQRSLHKHTLHHQQLLTLAQHHPSPTASSTSTSISISSSNPSTSVSVANSFANQQQRQIQSPGRFNHQLPRTESSFFVETDKTQFPFSHLTAHVAHADAVDHTNYDSGAMQPSSPDTPSTVPTLSSSPGESAATNNALPDHHGNNAVSAYEVQVREGPKSPSSPHSQGATMDSNSDRDIGRDNLVNDSFPEPVPGSGHGAYQNVPTPFHFPVARRTSVTSSVDNNNSAPSQQAQPTQQAPSNVESAANFGSYFAYCLDRGNGLYSRLIPADLLPPTAGVVALQNDSRGMIVLPDPSSQPSAGMPSPLVPAVSGGLPFGYASRPGQQNLGPYGAMQAPHPPPTGTIVQRTGQHGGNATKKHKVYCDKWVHEGICAFTQQGCKFKHEMPHDRSIQRSLGLFHGYPNWYKKLQLQDQQPLETPAMAPLALPAPPGLDQSSGLVHHTPFTSGLPYSSFAPMSVPAAPPPTLALHFPPTPYQPFCPPFGSSANSRLRTTSSTGIDGQWRSSGPKAASWRAQPASTTVSDGGASTTTSADLLAGSFARSLSVDKVTSAYQPDHFQQQQPITGTNSNTMSALAGTTAFSSFGYGLGGLGHGFGLGRPLGSLGESGRSGGAFGPIGPPPAMSNFPPPGVASPATTGFTYRATQAPSDGLVHDDRGRHSEWAEDEGGHLATEW